jgi:phosphoribosylaminoimidazole-succinocarboxamide synthase
VPLEVTIRNITAGGMAKLLGIDVRTVSRKLERRDESEDDHS